MTQGRGHEGRLARVRGTKVRPYGVKLAGGMKWKTKTGSEVRQSTWICRLLLGKERWISIRLSTCVVY